MIHRGPSSAAADADSVARSRAQEEFVVVGSCSGALLGRRKPIAIINDSRVCETMEVSSLSLSINRVVGKKCENFWRRRRQICFCSATAASVHSLTRSGRPTEVDPRSRKSIAARAEPTTCCGRGASILHNLSMDSHLSRFSACRSAGFRTIGRPATQR